MAGKWLEILSQQKIPSCIHRVVSMTGNGHRRLSAPFFLRPISEVTEQVKEMQHNRVSDGNKDMTVAAAVEELRSCLLRISSSNLADQKELR